MTYDLSYPGQRCIIEFLEANKRTRLVSRSPALQQAEKSIPFNLDHVQITAHSLALNNISIEIHPAIEQIAEDDPRYESRPADFRMQPGFIRSGHSDSVWHRKFNEVVFMRNEERIASRPLPEDMKDYIALEKVNQIMLGGRKDIRVNMLEFDVYFSRTILRLPEKIFEHPIVQNSDILTINELSRQFNEGIPLNDINKLTNRTVVIQHSKISKEGVMTLIRDWLSGEKSIGTTLMLEKHFVPINQEIFTSIKEYFEEFVIEDDFENVEENFLPDYPRFCIPINNLSNLLVYGIDRGIDNNFTWPVSAIVLKVVATTPEVTPGNCQSGVPLVLPSMIFFLGFLALSSD